MPGAVSLGMLLQLERVRGTSKNLLLFYYMSMLHNTFEILSFIAYISAELSLH